MAADEKPNYFNSTRHSGKGDVGSSLKRESDHHADQNKMRISFLHVPSGRSVFFKSFITAFNETYNSDWTPETVFGRVDPIYLFKNTTRKVNLNFKIPAESESEAFDNLARVQSLVQFLYPNYTTLTDPVTCLRDVNAQTISQSPLVRLKVLNLLHDQKGLDTSGTADKVLNSPAGTDYSAGKGVLGVIQNLTVNHNLEGDDGSYYEGPGLVLPKMIDLAISFSPIHEHPIGWDENSQPYNQMFPYGINDERATPGPVTPPGTDFGAAEEKPTQGFTGGAWDNMPSEQVERLLRTGPVGAVGTSDDIGNYLDSQPASSTNTPSAIKDAPAGQTAAAGNTGAAINQAMSGLGIDTRCAARLEAEAEAAALRTAVEAAGEAAGTEAIGAPGASGLGTTFSAG